ncbi:MAG: PLP-dependent cysteine synthase family protein [Pseudomonadota bacterium]
MQRIQADFNRSADTHLQKLELPVFDGIDLYLKDESIHPTGSLKHRLARSLILYGLCNGRIGPHTTLVEASSGSTAVSEAYFARLLELPFIAVVPAGTSSEKLKEIVRYGGRTVEVAAGDIYSEAERLADSLDGYYLDQFTNAERATDWRSNNNIAESLFQQLSRERFPTPHWVIVGAGTGGTSATIGRYLRYRAETYAQTRVCVADPEGSVFFDGFRRQDLTLTDNVRSRIEGVGRPRVEPSFITSVVDRMLKVPDALSIAVVWWLRELTGRSYGPSTGLNLCAALFLAKEMAEAGQGGSIVTLICDGGERYLDSCYASDWLSANGLAVEAALADLRAWLDARS